MLLSDFPQEIIERIADYLYIRDKISCSLVCKSWKRAFQDTIYSDIAIRSHEALKDITTPSQHSRRKYHKIGHLVRYLTIHYPLQAVIDDIYELQKTFQNIKYLYCTIYGLRSSVYGSIPDWNLWGSLTELYINIEIFNLSDIENSLVEAIVCLPLLRRLAIQVGIPYMSMISFSVSSFEIIHSHLKHLEYVKLSTSFLTLSDTDLERIAHVSPATTMKILDIIPSDTDYRWLCYFARKYPNLHTLNLKIFNILPDIKEQTDNTLVLFQQVPVSFQYLEKINLKYLCEVDGEELFFMDKINFHDTPLKHMSIEILRQKLIYYPYTIGDTPKIMVETFLKQFPKTIESLNLNSSIEHATPINLTGIENSLCNLVKVNINIPTAADIDVFLRGAHCLKSLDLFHADIKFKDELYNSERFELQSFRLFRSKITSDVLRFLSFHCRKLNTLSLVGTSVYGKITTHWCHWIDMTYSRLQSLYISTTRFIINGKDRPGNRNITLITRPIDDIPPKQEYDSNILPVNAEDIPFKAHNEWLYNNYPGDMIRISESQVLDIKNFIYYAEDERIAMEEVRQLKRLSGNSNKNFVLEFTKIDISYIANYKCITSFMGLIG